MDDVAAASAASSKASAVSPIRITLLGATGRIGGQALLAARRVGLDVTIVTRRRDPEPDGVRHVIGEVDDRDVLADALEGSDAVIAALGPRRNEASEAAALESAMRALSAAMAETGVRRLVALSGAGIHVPGDQARKPMVDRIASRFVRLAARHVVAAKQLEYDVFSSTDLDWTALRPAIVLDGPARGYRLAERLAPGARTTRADVGQALVDLVIGGAFVRAAPFVLPPG